MAEKDLTVTEAARRLGIHPNTLRKWADDGLIAVKRLPGSGFRRFSPEVVERIRLDMESGGTTGKAAAWLDQAAAEPPHRAGTRGGGTLIVAPRGHH